MNKTMMIESNKNNNEHYTVLSISIEIEEEVFEIVV